MTPAVLLCTVAERKLKEQKEKERKEAEKRKKFRDQALVGGGSDGPPLYDADVVQPASMALGSTRSLCVMPATNEAQLVQDSSAETIDCHTGAHVWL